MDNFDKADDFKDGTCNGVIDMDQLNWYKATAAQDVLVRNPL